MLQLTSCVFLCSPGVDELQLSQWIMNKDVSCTGDGSDTTFPAGDSTSLCECVSIDCSTDDTGSDEDTEEHHMIQFMDIDFESDSENDPDYFPCTPEMWSGHLDAPFADETAKGFAEDMGSVYWKYYHEEGESKFDESSDMESISHEVPIPRIRADLARLLGSASYERLDLLYSGETWVRGNGVLHLLIDNFTAFDR
ncbi:hypothetical protein BDV12DRAFT_200753 [Aspergillus spectabilis]